MRRKHSYRLTVTKLIHNILILYMCHLSLDEKEIDEVSQSRDSRVETVVLSQVSRKSI